MEKKRTIYAYSTETYYNYRKSHNDLPYIKVGDTERLAEDRVKEQDSTSNPEELNILKTWEVPCEYHDHDVHKILSARGLYRKRKNREWFEADIDDVDRAVNELLYGSSKKDSFSLRHNQLAFVEKAYSSFNSGYNKFLLAAIMRYGKTFATYMLCKKMNWNKILIFSAKTDVKKAWRDDVQNHVQFDGWIWNDSDGYSKTNPMKIENTCKTNVVFLSLQDAKDFTKDKLNDVLSIKYDVVIIDETHFAVDTERTDDLMKYISFDKRIDLSGTAFKRILSGEYASENSFVYGLIEEVRDIESRKYDGFTYNELPQLNLITINIEKQLLENLSNFYNKDEGFKFSTLFDVDDKNGELVHRAEARLFFDAIKTKNKREFGGISPWHMNEVSDKLDHMIWFLPKRVSKVKAATYLLRNHPSYSDYNIYYASGDNEGHSNEEILRKIERHAAKGEKTIVLSAGKFSTGVSVKSWNTVFMMNDGESPEDYFQSIFRCKTPDSKNNKSSCYVFDFNPQRALAMMYNYSQVTAEYEDKDTRTTLESFVEVLPIMNYEQNTLSKITVPDVISSLQKDPCRIWSSASMIDVENISDSLASIINNVEKINFIEEFEINNNNVNKGKSSLSSKEITSKGREKSEYTQLLDKARTIMSYIPAYLHLLDFQVDNVSDFIKFSNPDLFKQVSEIDWTLVYWMISDNVINKTMLTRALESMYLIEEL